MTLCSYCLMAGEQREEWRGRYNVALCSYCLMAGEQRVEWRGRYEYNVTFCSYCLMALRVAMTLASLSALDWAWVCERANRSAAEL